MCCVWVWRKGIAMKLKSLLVMNAKFVVLIKSIFYYCGWRWLLFLMIHFLDDCFCIKKYAKMVHVVFCMFPCVGRYCSLAVTLVWYCETVVTPALELLQSYAKTINQVDWYIALSISLNRFYSPVRLLRQSQNPLQSFFNVWRPFSLNDCSIYIFWWWSWWCHQMEMFSALLALCAGKSPVTGELPPQRPVTRSFDVFFDLHLE